MSVLASVSYTHLDVYKRQKLACKEIAHDGMVLEPYSDRVVRDLLCQS